MSLKKLERDFVNALQVQSTNDASIVSKCSMANSKYIKDDFVKHFVEREKNRAPLIHLGYYTRSVILSHILVKFIEYLHLNKIFKFQIISCGSGFDTTYWRLSEDGLLDNSLYIEIDYPNVMNRKLALINRSKKLRSILKNFEHENSTIMKLNSNYILLCVDLCDMQTVDGLLMDINVDFNVPTLFLSECVITYMKEKDSNRLIEWMSRKFKNSMFVNYEQIHPEDGFGEVMLRHFNKLQSTLYSVRTYPDCGSHKKRYKMLGFEKSVVSSEWNFLEFLTSLDERKRVLTLEQFDEFEEFHLKCTHYVVAVAMNNILCEWPTQMNIMEPLNSYKYSENAKLSLESAGDSLELFGHSSCLVQKNIAVIFGGVSPKGRSKKVQRFANGKVIEFCVLNSEDSRFDAVHGSVVSFELNGSTYLALYGGRTSPNKVINNGQLTLLAYSSESVHIKKLFTNILSPRYRHSMVCRSNEGSTAKIYIFGGRTADLEQRLGDLWEMTLQADDLGEMSCTAVEKEQKKPNPCCRMSHSAVINCTEDAMYITCGIDTMCFKILNDIWKWSFKTESWEQIIPKNQDLIPRYGHTSHINDNILYLLGGVNTISGCQPGLSLLNINTLYLWEFSVETFRIDPILLFNHTSVLIEDENTGPLLVIIGGGGNCFSFGTYFNKTSHVLTWIYGWMRLLTVKKHLQKHLYQKNQN